MVPGLNISKRIYVITRYQNLGLRNESILQGEREMNALNGPLSGNREKVKKYFVREDGRIVIICPECKKARSVSINKFSKRKTRQKVQCSCSHVFSIYLDYRQSYRKSTKLFGTYSLYTAVTGENLAKIKNLSFDGICLEVYESHSIQAGQKGCIDFTLDDKRKTQIKKEFLIQSVSGKHIGCRFIKEKAYERELGFYLRP